MTKQYELISKIKALLDTKDYVYEEQQSLDNESKWTTKCSIETRVKLSQDYPQSLRNVSNLLQDTLGKVKFTNENGEEEESYPFVITTLGTNRLDANQKYGISSEYVKLVKIQFTWTQDEAGATSFDSKENNKNNKTNK
ncbi:MAG: hypothetical protein EOM11_09725 [Erysipelotrichia bacterium]|nr:hypothetical protein [Erysipelotrichia bacterium]